MCYAASLRQLFSINQLNVIHFFNISGFFGLCVRLARSRGQAEQTLGPVLLVQPPGEAGQVSGRPLGHFVAARHPDGEVHAGVRHAPELGRKRNQERGKKEGLRGKYELFSFLAKILNGCTALQPILDVLQPLV